MHAFTLSAVCCRWCILVALVADTPCCVLAQLPSYGPWTSWSQCSVTCSDGTRFRYRQCPHDVSDPAYRHCPGEPIMFQPCHNPQCPATPQPRETTARSPMDGDVLEVDFDCDFECAPDVADCSQLEADCRTSRHDPGGASSANFIYPGGAGGRAKRRRRSNEGRFDLHAKAVDGILMRGMDTLMYPLIGPYRYIHRPIHGCNSSVYSNPAIYIWI